jgi:hypothetical protein
MPQFQLWDLPRSGANSLVKGFSVNRPAKGGFHCSRDDRHNGHEVVMKSNTDSILALLGSTGYVAKAFGKTETSLFGRLDGKTGNLVYSENNI